MYSSGQNLTPIEFHDRGLNPRPHEPVDSKANCRKKEATGNPEEGVGFEERWELLQIGITESWSVHYDGQKPQKGFFILLNSALAH